MQKSLTRLFTAVLMAALLVSASIISVSAANGDPCALHGDHADWTALTNESGNTYITEPGNYYLAGDITTAKADSTVGAITIKLPAETDEVTLCLNGHNIVVSGSGVTTGIRIEAGTLTICNGVTPTTDGDGKPTSGVITGAAASGRSVQVGTGGGSKSKVTIQDNVHLNNMEATSSSYALYVFGTVDMKGGTISYNTGTLCAVYVTGGTFNMSGGEIAHNEKTNGNGAGLNLNNATVTLSGTAKITGNKATKTGTSGALGGGVYLAGTTTLTMNGGTISDNSAALKGGGVYMAKGTFTMNNGTIGGEGAGNKTTTSSTSNGGAGVFVDDGTFTMNGGTISHNTATGNCRGGGVYLNKTTSSFVMSGDATISNNTALEGSGISSGTTSGTGGTVTINGGEISGNKSTGGSNGGAVCLIYVSEFNMTSGTITENTDSKGIGVFGGASVTITVGGDAVIAGNVKTDGTPATADLRVGSTGASATISGGSFASMTVASGSKLQISGGKFGTEEDETLLDTLNTYKGTDYIVNVLSGSAYAYAVAFEWDDCAPDGHGDWTAITNDMAEDGVIELDLADIKEGKYYLAEPITAQIFINNASAAVAIDVCMNGYSSIVESGAAGFRVGENVTMNLCNCGKDDEEKTENNGVIRGNSGYNALLIIAGGKAIMNDGVHISGTEAAPVDYGTVNPIHVNGSFHMKGGDISYNISNTSGSTERSGGVALAAGTAEFIMDGGTISHNQGSAGGGVLMLGGTSKFTMNNGTISNNVGTKRGGGVSVEGANATFVMKNGSITNNDGKEFGGGVNVRKGTFTMENGTIKDNTLTGRKLGTQVVVGNNTTDCIGTFTMNGGTITGSNDYDTVVDPFEDDKKCYVGGDVVVGMGSATINEGSTITGHVGTVGFIEKSATLAINGGTFNGRVTNGEILRGGQYPDTAASKDSAKRGTCIVTITGGEFIVTITGGEFSLVNDRDKLGEMLAKAYEGNTTNDKILSIKENGAETPEATYYVVAEGFHKTGEQLEWGSSLGLGVYLNADVIPVNADISLKGSVSSDDIEVDGKVEAAGNDVAGYKLVAHGIAAKDMDKKVTFLVTDSSGTVEYYNETHSIYELAEDWAKDKDKESMVVDMINYGIEAQKAFVPNQEPMSALKGYSGSTGDVTWNSDGIDVIGQGQVGVSLNLKERIELNIYVPGEDQTVVSATQADKEMETTDYEFTNVSGYTRITFGNINVTDVKDKIAVVTSGGYSVTCSIADYVVGAINKGSQVDLMKALQRYVESVSNYVRPANGQ